MNIANIAAYKFIALNTITLENWRELFKTKATQEQLKGTILLSPEGINLMLAGEQVQIEQFKQYLGTFPELADLTYKTSHCAVMPFKRLFVKIKKEIITFGVPHIEPNKFTAPYLEPTELKAWYEQAKDMIILDTRNDYEIEAGKFKDAVHLNIENFTEFPEAIKTLPENIKDKVIVTYCTGGIRCEKAAAYMLTQGFKHVYQLQGGILNYFAECGDAHYQGQCFVFDERIAVDGNLQPVNDKAA